MAELPIHPKLQARRVPRRVYPGEALMLLAIYAACLAAGGGFVLLSSVFGADGDADMDIDGGGDLELDFDADGGIDADGGFDADAEGGGDFDIADWLPFFSFRFWTFALAFFGLSGLVLTALGTLAPPLVALLAAATGVLSGSAVHFALHRLQQQQLGSMVTTRRLLGAEAEVRTAVRGSRPGEVVVTIGGRTMRLLAISDRSERLEAGSPVVIIAFKDGKAHVVPQREFLPEEE